MSPGTGKGANAEVGRWQYCTVDKAHLKPQSTERISARVQNTNIHTHRQTLLRYRPRERVFESYFLSVFRHK